MPMPIFSEVIDTPIYDTVGLPRPSGDAEMPRVELFEVPIGGMGRDWSGHFRTKSTTETNLINSRRLSDASHRMMLRSIRAAFIDLAGSLMPVAQSSRFYRSSILRLTIGRKWYWEGPLFKVADPAVMFLEPDALRGFSPEDRSDVVRSLRHQFSHEETSPLIDHDQEFYCTIEFDSLARWDGLAAPAAVVVLLEGQLCRPVV